MTGTVGGCKPLSLASLHQRWCALTVVMALLLALPTATPMAQGPAAAPRPGEPAGSSDPMLGLWGTKHVCGKREISIKIAIVDVFTVRHALVVTTEEALEPTNPRRTLISTFGVPRGDPVGGKVRFKWYGGAHGGLGFSAQAAPGTDRLVADLEGCTGIEFRRAQGAGDRQRDATYVGTWSGHLEACRVGGVLATRMALVKGVDEDYWLDAEYTLNPSGNAKTAMSNRQLFRGQWDQSAGKMVFRIVVALSTKLDGQPNPHASFSMRMENLTLDYDGKETRLNAVASFCPHGEFVKEGLPQEPKSDSPIAELIGDWEGYAKCGQTRDAPVLLQLATFGALRAKGVIEYVPANAHARGVIRQVVSGQANANGDGYTFAIDDVLMPTGSRRREMMQGFTLKREAGGPGFVATVGGWPCSSFHVTRVSNDSPWRRSSVEPPANGGTFVAARRPQEKCEVFTAWARKVLAEYPGLGVNVGVGDGIYPKVALLFTDEHFVPVFGAPFDKLELDKRWQIGTALTENGCYQPEFRIRELERWVSLGNKIQDDPAGHHPTFGVTAIFATVRESRRLNTVIRATHGGLPDDAPFARALEVLEPLERQIRTNVDVLWPSDHRAALAHVATRLARFAFAEVERDMALIAAIADPVARLKELREVYAGARAYKKYLQEVDRTALEARALATQKTVAEGAIGQTLAAIEAMPVSEDALPRIQALLQRVEPVLVVLIDSLAMDYRGRIDRKRQAVFEDLVGRRLAALKALRADKAGLAASARWPDELHASFTEFAPSPTYRKAIEEHRIVRNRQLRDAVAAFEEELKRLPNDPDRPAKVDASLRQFLAGADDNRLPSSLEYRLLAESYRAMAGKP